MIVSFISKCTSIYKKINQKIRLFFLLILCPLSFSLLYFLLIASKSINHGHPAPLFILLMLVPDIFLTILCAAILILFIYEWYVLVVRKVKNVVLFNTAILLGALWPAFSLMHFSKAIAEYFFLLFSRP